MANEEKELVERLRHLVSLNEPRHGGPYQGAAAEACVTAMSEAASTIERLSAIEQQKPQDILKLWREHGGDTFGPHVEHVSMPLSKFWAFCDALRALNQTRTDASEAPDGH